MHTPLALATLTSAVLPAGTLTRIVATPPPRQLLSTLYGADAPAALAVLAATDAVLNRSLGGVHLVQPADWPVCPGAGWILAPFVRAPAGANASRFTDGSYGVWYGAESVATAQAEVGHHLARMLADTVAAPGTLPRTATEATPDPTLPVVDLRPPNPAPADVLDAASYAASQPFGAHCRRAQHWGLLWPSVRRPGGTCVGVLRPPLLVGAREAGTCAAEWDGARLRWV